MELIRHNPSNSVAPASAYAQGAEVRDASRWLHVSGQIGLDASGTLAGDSRAQMRQSFSNLLAVLAEAGMEKSNIVKLTAFITRAEDVALYREVREEMLGGHLAASTLLVISALAHPQWTVEIEAIAAA